MTINVSVEELKDYQKACDTWIRLRAKAVEEAIIENRAMASRYEDVASRVYLRADFMAKWDEMYPFPKIIPVV